MNFKDYMTWELIEELNYLVKINMIGAVYKSCLDELSNRSHLLTLLY